MSGKFAAAFLGLAIMAGRALGATWVTGPVPGKLTFTGTQSGVPFTGEFRKFSAHVSFDPDHLDQSAVNITIDMASAETGGRQRDDMIRNANWFDVKRFPAAVFKAAKFTRASNGVYDAEGTLTIRNVTHHVSLPFRLRISGETAEAKGSLVISRKDYDIGTGAWASDQIVGYPVKVEFDIWARAR